MEQSSLAMTRRRVLVGGALLLSFALLPRLARAALPAALSAPDQADVQRMVAYLNDIHTLESHFDQIAADGADSSGTIDVERPGKLRLQYDPPLPILIVSDGRDVFYWDPKLEQLSRTLIDDTPAWFLLRPDITASGDVTVTRFLRQPGVLQLTMAETAKPELGTVTLTMADDPLELRQWTVIDAQNRPVTVSLTDPRFGMPIDPRVFNWIDPRRGSGASTR
jgi:outer membrane lipoprotein-sorting protein